MKRITSMQGGEAAKEIREVARLELKLQIDSCRHEAWPTSSSSGKIALAVSGSSVFTQRLA
jgi:hypothetical protein